MNSYRVIDKETWPRKELFDFYQTFLNPNFNISIQLEAGNLVAFARDRGDSLFQLALYAIVRAANAVPQVRQRILDGQVIEYNSIAVMTPIMTEQSQFRQVWCEYAATFPAFAAQAAPAITEAKTGSPAPLLAHAEDYLVASCVPWMHFTAITQAVYHNGQAVPILAWGKVKDNLIPFSCQFHHAFVDGLHCSQFFGNIEDSFANPDRLLQPAGPRFRIRPAALDDMPRLASLWRRSVEATHAFLTSADIDALEKEVRQGLGGLNVWVAEAENTLTGFMATNGDMIEALFIEPAFMGKGVGTLFIDHAQTLLGTGGTLRVDVNEHNPDALGFYVAQGFRQRGRSETDAAGRPWPILHLAREPLP